MKLSCSAKQKLSAASAGRTLVPFGCWGLSLENEKERPNIAGTLFLFLFLHAGISQVGHKGFWEGDLCSLNCHVQLCKMEEAATKRVVCLSSKNKGNNLLMLTSGITTHEQKDPFRSSFWNGRRVLFALSTTKNFDGYVCASMLSMLN